jgi:hypothetical protein
MEWVIGKINVEVEEMKQTAAKGMDGLAKRRLSETATT